MFRKPVRKEWLYLALAMVMYASAVTYVLANDLSLSALFNYGLLQPPGITGEQARLADIPTPFSWNLPRVAWFIYIKGAAVLTELFQYWIVGLVIAASLVIFVPWETVKHKMGYGGVKANVLAATAGAVIPICSCGIVPVLAGMVEAGIPLGATMSFLIAAPMLNVPAVFITAGVLGWKMAIGRVLGTLLIALSVGGVMSYWQRKERLLRRFVKLSVTPNLSPELQQFAFKVGMTLAKQPKLLTEELAPGQEERLYLLGEAGILDRNPDGLWHLPEVTEITDNAGGSCFVMPSGDLSAAPTQKARRLIQTTWDFFLRFNYYLVLAVVITGAIKVLLPTSIVIKLVGGEHLNSILITTLIAVFAYLCTYVEVPTALALIQKGMGGGATLAYLLGGPGLSLPSIAMLSGVFTPKVLALYVGISFVGCVFAGYVFNLL